MNDRIYYLWWKKQSNKIYWGSHNSLHFANQAISNSSNVIVESIENSNVTILYLVCLHFPSPILHPKFNFETFCVVINGRLYQPIFFSRDDSHSIINSNYFSMKFLFLDVAHIHTNTHNNLAQDYNDHL